MMRAFFTFFKLILFSFLLSGCSQATELIPLEVDQRIGQQLSDQIQESPDFTVLDSGKYDEVYNYVQGIRDQILQSEHIKYRDKFPYNVTILKNDDELNAFASPAGHIYVYTGLIKYLDTKAQLAGVLAHEIAHAEERHAVEQMAGRLGIGLLTSLIFEGDYGQLIALGENLLALNFSRSDESEADELAVEYLYDTPYDPRGVAGFFEKLKEENQAEVPSFFSTHPASEDRVKEIMAKWEELGSKEGKLGRAEHQKIVERLSQNP